MKNFIFLALTLSLVSCNLHKKQICDESNSISMDKYAKRYKRTVALLGVEVADGTMELIKTARPKTYQLKMIDKEETETIFEDMRFCKIGNQIIAESTEMAEVDGKEVEASMLFPVQAKNNELIMYLAYGEAASLDEKGIPYQVISANSDWNIEVILVDNSNVEPSELIIAYDLYGFFKGTR